MNDVSVSPMVRECARLLADGERTRRAGAPLTELYPALAIAEAYAIQQLNIAQRVAAGDRVVGHKIGLTAKAMQELFGVTEPDYGHLLASMVHEESAPLDLSTLIDPMIEVEPAFVLARRLQGPGVTAAEVIAATDYLAVSLEVIDSRITNWRIKLQDTVADNGSSARVIVGSKRVDPHGLALDDLVTTLSVDGQVIETSNTRAILGHPARGIAWLANAIAPFGAALEPGHLVLPGTCTKAYRLNGKRTVTGHIAGLGGVTLTLANAPTITTRT